jgi:hypothetical protein
MDEYRFLADLLNKIHDARPWVQAAWLAALAGVAVAPAALAAGAWKAYLKCRPSRGVKDGEGGTLLYSIRKGEGDTLLVYRYGGVDGQGAFRLLTEESRAACLIESWENREGKHGKTEASH